MTRIHGGADQHGLARWDFSTNANSCAPCPELLKALQRVDARHYPDPNYSVLRSALAGFHGVEVERIVLAASASEFILRITAHAAQRGALPQAASQRGSSNPKAAKVYLPNLSYGEYAHAASVWNLQRTAQPKQADLVWLCEPSSPLGQHEWLSSDMVQTLASHSAGQGGALLVLDCAYEPLRLSGQSSFTPQQRKTLWQLFSPNKALGMTGIRGAYAIAPEHQLDEARAVAQLTPSWPLGAHALCLLHTWTQNQTQAWVQQSLSTLRDWKDQQIKRLQAWPCLPSDTNFFCMQAQLDTLFLRDRGIKLRDTQSFGLPGHWRLSVQPPEAQQALLDALQNGGAL